MAGLDSKRDREHRKRCKGACKHPGNHELERLDETKEGESSELPPSFCSLSFPVLPGATWHRYLLFVCRCRKTVASFYASRIAEDIGAHEVGAALVRQSADQVGKLFGSGSSCRPWMGGMLFIQSRIQITWLDSESRRCESTNQRSPYPNAKNSRIHKAREPGPLRRGITGSHFRSPSGVALLQVYPRDPSCCQATYTATCTQLTQHAVATIGKRCSSDSRYNWHQMHSSCFGSITIHSRNIP